MSYPHTRVRGPVCVCVFCAELSRFAWLLLGSHEQRVSTEQVSIDAGPTLRQNAGGIRSRVVDGRAETLGLGRCMPGQERGASCCLGVPASWGVSQFPNQPGVRAPGPVENHTHDTEGKQRESTACSADGWKCNIKLSSIPQRKT